MKLFNRTEYLEGGIKNTRINVVVASLFVASTEVNIVAVVSRIIC